jgi:glycosyltransferase involved in cell wall biosynthesis
LFAIYNDLTCNSASHVDGVARELSGLGCDCLVATPATLAGIHRFQPLPYRTVIFDEVLQNPRLFSDGRGPDFLHVWNPREVNRKFRDRLAECVSFRTVIHLEDNEEHITRSSLGRQAFAQAVVGAFSGEFPEGLTHPRLSRGFMHEAAGFSLLIESLAEMIPREKPHMVFWPAADRRIFYPRPRNDTLREELGISPKTCVLTYHGNMHAANFSEIRSLYLAVALLSRSGVPAKLIRVGTNHVPLTDEYDRWAREFTIDLGYVVDRRRLTEILATADVFVQPGGSDPFNDYRFPSKLPEFFAMGKPVVLPKANIGLVTRHLEDAYLLEEANGPSICNAVIHIRSDPRLIERLSEGARAFEAAHFSWQKSARALLDFYLRLEDGIDARGLAA